MKATTVIITHYNRETNLTNALDGLNKQSIIPDRVVVIDMGSPLPTQPAFKFELLIIPFPYDWSRMPLAAARNFGATHALSGTLIFLNVDCIPAVNFCEAMARAASEKDGLVMGTPKYLLFPTPEVIDENWLETNSVFHPIRPLVKTIRKESCYELFWSLCFAIPATIFDTIGGFDELYTGYGAEDTDFALHVQKHKIPFYLSPVGVYHQQHPVYVPPINHLQSIVQNCNYTNLTTTCR